MGENSSQAYRTTAFHRDSFMGSSRSSLTLPNGHSSAPIHLGPLFLFLETLMVCTLLGRIPKNFFFATGTICDLLR